MKKNKKTIVFDWKKEMKKEELLTVVKVLENDGIIVFPTDTVYGIACNGFSETAIQQLYEIKNRPLSKPICVLTDSLDNIKKIAETNQKEEEIIKTYMPGALTIVLKKKNNIPNLLTAGFDTVGVRIPDHQMVLTILKDCSFPLATTSANESGEKEGRDLEDVYKDFFGKVDIIIDGGPSKSSKASTIIKIEQDQIQVLREGNIKF